MSPHILISLDVLDLCSALSVLALINFYENHCYNIYRIAFKIFFHLENFYLHVTISIHNYSISPHLFLFLGYSNIIFPHYISCYIAYILKDLLLYYLLFGCYGKEYLLPFSPSICILMVFKNTI